MNRNEALAIVAGQAEMAGAYVFAGNGYNARALCAVKDRPEFFYMVGSMGLCPALAAGFARFVSRPVLAVEGDGNALMGLSGYPACAAAVRGTFVHLVLDNGLYETTGGQRTLAGQVDLVRVATAVGYLRALSTPDETSLERALAEALRSGSMTFIHVPTDITKGPPPPRVSHHPRVIKSRFRHRAAEDLVQRAKGGALQAGRR